MRHGQSRGEDKRPKQGGIFIILHYSFCDYKMLQNTRTAICSICYLLLLLSRGHRSLLLQTRALSRYVLGKFLPPQEKTWNFPSPRIFAMHVDNYNLNIVAKSNANYSTGICYMLSEVLIFVDKCSKSKLSKSPRCQQTPRYQQKTKLHAYSCMCLTLSASTHTSNAYISRWWRVWGAVPPPAGSEPLVREPGGEPPKLEAFCCISSWLLHVLEAIVEKQHLYCTCVTMIGIVCIAHTLWSIKRR